MIRTAITIFLAFILVFANKSLENADEGWTKSLGATSHLTSKMVCFADRSLCKKKKSRSKKNIKTCNTLTSCKKINKKLRRKIDDLEKELINLHKQKNEQSFHN